MPLTFKQRRPLLLPHLVPDGPDQKTPVTVRDGLLWALAARSPAVERRIETLGSLLEAADWQSARQVLSAQGVAAPEHPALPGQEWLGYGYTPFGTIPDEASTRELLFDIPCEFAGESWNAGKYSRFACVEFNALGNSGLTKVDVSTIEDVSRSLTASAAVSGERGLFGGELSTSLSLETSRHWEYMFSRIQLHHDAYRLRLPGRPLLQRWLRPAVRDALLHAVASESAFHHFLDTYGTHYVNGIIVGAHASIYSAYSKTVYGSKQAMQVDMAAHYAAVEGRAGAEIRRALEQTSSRLHTCIVAYGAHVGPTCPEDLAMDAWQAKAAANPAWSGFAQGGAPGETGLVPIYWLVEDGLQSTARKWWESYLDANAWISQVGTCVTEVNVYGHRQSGVAMSGARAGNRFSLLPTDSRPVDVNEGAKGWFIYVGAHGERIGSDMRAAITDLKTVRGRNAPAPPGYTRIDFDLNCGCGGKTDFIFLCFERGNHERVPIRALSLVALDSAMTTPAYSGWEVVQDMSGENSDLNRGAGGKFIYLLVSRS